MRPEKDDIKKLICPVCGCKRLIDARKGCVSELNWIEDAPPDWEPDYYQKCPTCKNEIGIKKVC